MSLLLLKQHKIVLTLSSAFNIFLPFFSICCSAAIHPFSMIFSSSLLLVLRITTSPPYLLTENDLKKKNIGISEQINSMNLSLTTNINFSLILCIIFCTFILRTGQFSSYLLPFIINNIFSLPHTHSSFQKIHSPTVPMTMMMEMMRIQLKITTQKLNEIKIISASSIRQKFY